MDQITERAARLFLQRVRQRYAPRTEAWVFGSQARQSANAASDVDIAVLLPGATGARADAAIDMAGIAFDVMLETGVLVDPLPLWEEEWTHPERFANPALLANIQRDGVRL